MSPPLPLRFVLSAAHPSQLPDLRAEVALLGRSNVGKSSLVNALAARKQLAKVSGTPGRTQQLNCYALDDGSALIDCPGYGYAVASKSARAAWQRTVRGYLAERPPLVHVLLLIDGMVGPTALDVEMITWLAEQGIGTWADADVGTPLQIVATKADRVKASQRTRRARDLAAGCGVEPADVLWSSATTGSGIDAVRDLIRAALTQRPPA